MKDALRFCQIVYLPDDIVEARAILKRDKDNSHIVKKWTAAKNISALLPELGRLNQVGYNIYAGVNARKGFNLSGDDNVIIARTVFVDFDHIEAADGLSPSGYVLEKIACAGLPDPTIIINSGHGIHAYWKLREPLKDLTVWKDLQARLIDTLGSDPAIKNPERIMRLAGFRNNKPPCADCFIIEANEGRIHELATIEAALLPPKITVSAPIPSKQNDDEERFLRAKLYAAKWETLSEGQRDTETFKRAARLRERFGLSESQTFEIVAAKNNLNNPPLSEGEIKKAVANAYRYANKPAGSGYNPMQYRKPDVFIDTPRPDDPAGELEAVIESEIAGRRLPVAWSWDMLTALTRSLIPETVCVFCGNVGASKSFAILQNVLFWLHCNIKVAFFALEDNHTYHLRRALAQLAEIADIANPDFVRANPDIYRNAMRTHREAINQFGRVLWTAQTQPTQEQIADWVRQRCKEGYRIIAIDPITATAQTDKTWIADNAFLQAVKIAVCETGASLILITHPKQNVSFPDVNQLAGSAAYSRFAQSIIWLESHDPKDNSVKTDCGTCEISHNRTIHLLKTRNGAGQGWKLAYSFDPNSLTLKELGTIIKPKKERKQKDES